MQTLIKKAGITLLLSLLVISSFAEKPMGRPLIFTNQEKSYTWAAVAASHNWGQLTNQAWKVYADRDKTPIYTEPDASSAQAHRTLGFLDPVYISETNGDFAKVWSQLDSKSGDVTKALGWVELDKLLLWETCPRTQGQIYEKALILTNLSSKNRNKESIKAKPVLSNSPEKMVSNGSSIHELEFFFIYKYDENGNALLLKTNEVSKGLVSARGWVSQGKYTNWNSRVCYEPNPDSSLKNKYAVVFQDAQQADMFFRDGRFDPQDTVRYKYVWYEKLAGQRWGLDIPRLPILRPDNNAQAYDADKVGTIARISEKASGNSDAYAKALHKLHDLQDKMKQINIVIVMDGTMSMQKYYPQMCEAIREAMQDTKLAEMNPNFGAVVYRNEVDGPAQYKPLTNEYNNIANWLENIKCGTQAPASEHYESMFEGLRCAVNNMNWSKQNANFIILVGDAASKKNDKYNLTEQKIGGLLATKDINLIAFQANHYNHEAYDDFRQQITDIMYAELGNIFQRQLTVSDFSFGENHQTYQSGTREEVIMQSAYISAAIGQKGSSASLQSMVVENITDFRKLMEDRITSVNIALEESRDGGTTGGTLNKNILRHTGLTDGEIETLSNSAFNTNGYTKNYANGKEVLVSSVFLTDQELNHMLIPRLKQVANISENPRGELQKALEDLAKTFLGELDQTMSINELMRKVLDLPEVVSVFPEEIAIRDLQDVALVSDAQITSYINQITRDVRHLESKSTESQFRKDNSTYYYILVKDMPMQTR